MICVRNPVICLKSYIIQWNSFIADGIINANVSHI